MKRYWPLAPATIAFVVYFLTTCRGIWIGDSAEFALALQSVGIAHPPGYPLFTLMGSIFVQALAFVRPIFAGGIYNVLLASASVAVIFLIVRRSLDNLTSAGLALVWAFTSYFWSETNGVEIYTLNILLIALIYFTLESDSPKKWFILTYLLGLSFCNHPSAVALIPAVVYRFVVEKEYKQVKRIPVYLTLLAVCAAMYLYLWLRSIHDPISDWGDPEGFAALWQHMTLKQYSGWVANSWSSLVHTVFLYARGIVECWWWLGALLTLSGAVLGIKYRRERTINALLILATSVFMAAFHQAVNFEPFYLLPLFASLLLISNNFAVLGKIRIPASVAPIAAIAAAVLLLVFGYRENDKSNYRLYEDYTRALLDSPVPNGVIFNAGDINAFGTAYLRYAENYRPDVELYDRSIHKRALLQRASALTGNEITDLFMAREILLKRESARKYFAKSHYQNEPDWWEALDSIHSYGMLYDSDEPVTTPPAVPVYPPDFDGGDLMSHELLVNLDLIRGEEALVSNPPDTAAALILFRQAMDRYRHEPRGLLLNQLGIYFRRTGFGDLALEAYERALQKPLLTKDQEAEIRFNQSNIYKDRGNLAMRNVDYEAAVRLYRKAAEYDPSDPRLLLNIGLIYNQHLGDRTNAKIYLERYLELEPNDTRVRQLLTTLR